MNKIAIAGIIAGALITAAAVDTLRQARNQLRSIKLLNKQVEEDHSQLVKLYLQTRRKLREQPRPDISPEDFRSLRYPGATGGIVTPLGDEK